MEHPYQNKKLKNRPAIVDGAKESNERNYSEGIDTSTITLTASGKLDQSMKL